MYIIDNIFLLGAIAFAMALQIKSENKTSLVNTVMVVIVFTIVILSSLLQVFSRYVGLQGNEEEEIIKKYVYLNLRHLICLILEKLVSMKG